MPQVTVEARGPVAVLTLDDGKANAVRPELLAALDAALDEVEAGDTRSLVVAGRPGFFCGGLDLKRLPELSRAEQRDTFAHFGRVLTRLFLFGRPTVAAMTGHAIAGGALLAMACDVRLGVDGGYRFGVSEVAIGLPMPAFGVEVVRAAVPGVHLAEALLHGRLYTHAQAREVGMVEGLNLPERVTDVAVARARGLAEVPSEAYALTKRRLRAASADAALRALDDEIEDFLDRFARRA